jgi:hypothetical protein
MHDDGKDALYRKFAAESIRDKIGNLDPALVAESRKVGSASPKNKDSNNTQEAS